MTIGNVDDKSALLEPVALLEGRIQRLQLEPGDVVVFEYPRAMKPDAWARAVARLRDHVPSGVAVMLLDAGLRLAGVLGRPHGKT